MISNGTFILFDQCTFSNLTANPIRASLATNATTQQYNTAEYERAFINADEYEVFNYNNLFSNHYCAAQSQHHRPPATNNNQFTVDGSILIHFTDFLHFSNSQFINNIGLGPVLLLSNSNIKLSNVNFTNNYSHGRGNVIIGDCNVDISYSTFTNNSNLQNSIIYSEFSTLNIVNSVFNDNIVIIKELLHMFVANHSVIELPNDGDLYFDPLPSIDALKAYFQGIKDVWDAWMLDVDQGNQEWMKRLWENKEREEGRTMNREWSVEEWEYLYKVFYQLNKITEMPFIRQNEFDISFLHETGIVYFNASTAFVHECSFHNNYGYYGGCIYFNNLFDLLQYNTTTADSSFLHPDHPSSNTFEYHTLSIDRSVFEKNLSTKGAGVFIRTFNNNDTFSQVTVNESIFSTNYAVAGTSLYLVPHPYNYGFLGDLNRTSIPPSVSHTQEIPEILHEPVVFNYVIKIADSNFTNNHALVQGSCLWSEGLTYGIHSCMFDNNKAALRGGVVYQTDIKYSEIKFSFFNHSYATFGAVLHTDSNTTILSSTFTYNHASQEGGVLFIINDAFVILSELFFFNNTSDNLGGCILSRDFTNVRCNNSRFDSNSARERGGAWIGLDGTQIFIENSHFTNGTASEGICFYFDNHSINQITNITVENNRGAAGTIYMTGESYLDLSASTFTDNIILLSGGAIIMRYNSSLDILGCEFTNNLAGIYGGAIHSMEFGRITITECEFINNVGISGGGALCALDGCVISITNSTYNNNFSNKSGGALLMKDEVQIDVHSCNFTENDAGNQGGAIYVQDNCLFHLYSSIIQNSTVSTSGGGIVFTGFSLGYIESSLIQFNFALSKGGAFASTSQSNLIINNTVFHSNNSTGAGCGILQDKSNFTCTFCVFSSNNATTEGGALVLSDNSISSFMDCAFVMNNVSLGIGGAILIDDYAISEFTRVNFTDNYAKSAGAFYTGGSSSPVCFLCLFTGNMAQLNGGALMACDFAAPSFRFSSFINNTASDSGSTLFPLFPFPFFLPLLTSFSLPLLLFPLSILSLPHIFPSPPSFFFFLSNRELHYDY